MNTFLSDETRALRDSAHVTLAPRAPRKHRLAGWIDANGAPGLILAALIALGYAWWLLGYPMLRGTAPFWWRDNADITQYLAGFNAYVSDGWHWPLLRFDTLNTPEGTLATFLDTVPLYALFLKLVHPGSGYWNPFGLWLALCFTLQGVGAWWICREARVRNWAALATLALLLASFPALTFRISHTSLMSQWILVFAFAVYLRSARLGRLATPAWMALLVGAFYINIYLFVMASAIFGADVLRQLLRTPASLASVGHALLAPLAVYGLLFASMWIMVLPLPPGASSPEWGFGHFSMNLLAPLHGGQLLQLEHPVAHDGQGEGFNYLGVFVLALTLVSYKLLQRRDPDFWRRHGALLGVLVLFTMFALSNIVWLGEHRVYTLQLPPWMGVIVTTLRASGRFFWPVGYAIVLFAVLGVARHVAPWRAAALLAAVTALQIWDLQAHHDYVRKLAAQHTAPAVDAARWNAFLGPAVKALHYYPPFRCDETPGAHALLPVMNYAVKHAYPLSTGYIARAAKSCDHYGATIARLPASTAVAFEKQVFPRQQDAERLMGASAICADMDIVFLCRRTNIHLRNNQP